MFWIPSGLVPEPQKIPRELLVYSPCWHSKEVGSAISGGVLRSSNQAGMNLPSRVKASRQKAKAFLFPVLLFGMTPESEAQT